MVVFHIGLDFLLLPSRSTLASGGITNNIHAGELLPIVPMFLFPTTRIIGYANIDNLVALLQFILVRVSFLSHITLALELSSFPDLG